MKDLNVSIKKAGFVLVIAIACSATTNLRAAEPVTEPAVEPNASVVPSDACKPSAITKLVNLLLTPVRAGKDLAVAGGTKLVDAGKQGLGLATTPVTWLQETSVGQKACSLCSGNEKYVKGGATIFAAVVAYLANNYLAEREIDRTVEEVREGRHNDVIERSPALRTLKKHVDQASTTRTTNSHVVDCERTIAKAILLDTSLVDRIVSKFRALIPCCPN